MKRLLLFSVFSIFCLTISAQTKTWVGPTGGSFNLAANWNPTGVPGSINDVIIPTGSDILIDGNANIQSFDLQGNAKMTIIDYLTTSQASSISSAAIVTWNSTGLWGTGTITNNGTINLMTLLNKNMANTVTLINNGTINFNNASDFIIGYGSPTLNNAASGTINFNSTGNITYSQGVGLLKNSGLIKKSQDSGLCEILCAFTNNNGTILVENGTLKLNSNTVSLIDGTYNVTTGNTMEWTNNYTLLGTLTGQLNGQLNLSGNYKVEPATEAIFAFTGPSGVNWTGGFFLGNGTLTNNGIFNLTSTNGKIVGGISTIKNNATLNVNSSGDFTLSGNSTLNNTTSGIVNLNSTGQITYTQGVGSFINSGLIKKTQDPGLYEIGPAFTNNGGTISVEKGTLKLSYTSSLIGGTYNVTAGNTLEWATNYTLSGTLTGQLDGELNLSGNLKVEPSTEAILNFTGPSGVNWTGGNFQGNGTLTNIGILNLTGTNVKNVVGTSTLKNDGIFNVSSPWELVLGYGNPTLNNTASGVINLNTGGSITYSQGVGTLINSGLIKKAQENGLYEIVSAFTNNNGTISVEKGPLKLNSGATSLIGGTYNVTAGNSMEWANNYTLSGTLTGQLDGELNLSGNLKVEPATEAIFNFTGPSGVNWTGGNFQGNGTLTNKGILNLTSTNTKNVSGTSTLKNDGVININSAYDLVLGYGTPTLRNSASGIINLNTDGSITYSQGVGTLENSRLIKKEVTSGTFDISANTNNISPGKIICDNGLLTFGTYTGNGVLGGNGSVKLASNTTFEGTISPGGFPGILNHVGNFKSSANAILNSEIYGPLSGAQYDVFNVQGNAILNGNIQIALSYAASLNDEFIILTSTAITSCNLPATVVANYDSRNYTFDVICGADKVTLKVTSILLGKEDNTLNNLTLYPNPSNGRFTIDLGKEYSEVTVQISNILGQIISSQKYDSTRIIENEINDSRGIHFVKVSIATGESTTLKIINK